MCARHVSQVGVVEGVPLDESVLTFMNPTSMRQPVNLVNTSAKGTVIAVEPISVVPAKAEGLVGLNEEDQATVGGKEVYFLTYRVSYVNGEVNGIGPYVILSLSGRDDNHLETLSTWTRPEPQGCLHAQTAGQTFGVGVSYTECSIEFSESGSKPALIEYFQYPERDAVPVWPVE